MGRAQSGLAQEGPASGKPGLNGWPCPCTALPWRHETSEGNLNAQALGRDHAVGQPGQRLGVGGPRAAGGTASDHQRLRMVDDGEEATPGVVEEFLDAAPSAAALRGVALLERPEAITACQPP